MEKRVHSIYKLSPYFQFLINRKIFFFYNTRSSVDNLSVHDTASVTDIKAKALDNVI